MTVNERLYALRLMPEFEEASDIQDVEKLIEILSKIEIDGDNQKKIIEKIIYSNK